MRMTIVALGLLLTASGCESDDREHLEKIGQLTHVKLRTVFPAIPVSFDGLREALRSGGPGTAIEVRVRSRLQADKALKDVPVEIRETEPGRVVLSGQLSDDRRKQTALDLARTTVGVEAVVDDLRVGEGE